MSTSATAPQRAGPRRRSQAERSQTTQRKIVDSALRLLQKVGFQQTNLQDIARGAKVTMGALQHQFGSRQVLMERVVDEVMAPLADVGAAWPEHPEKLPLNKRASEFVRLAWERVYSPPSYVAAWSLFFGCKTTPQLFKRIDEHRATHDPLFFAHFVRVFPEVAKRHKQPEHFAAVIFAALRGLAVMRLFKVDEEATEQQLDVIAKMIVQAAADVK
jgi:AcrR family transcriptional regulator